MDERPVEHLPNVSNAVNRLPSSRSTQTFPLLPLGPFLYSLCARIRELSGFHRFERIQMVHGWLRLREK